MIDKRKIRVWSQQFFDFSIVDIDAESEGEADTDTENTIALYEKKMNDSPLSLVNKNRYQLAI